MIALYPDYERVVRMENLRWSLVFAFTAGHYERASELADEILDLVCPTP